MLGIVQWVSGIVFWVNLASLFNLIVQDFEYFLAASETKNCEKEAVIKSAASAASTQGGCASSRLDHGSKFYVIRGGCASSQKIVKMSDSVVF